MLLKLYDKVESHVLPFLLLKMDNLGLAWYMGGADRDLPRQCHTTCVMMPLYHHKRRARNNSYIYDTILILLLRVIVT